MHAVVRFALFLLLAASLVAASPARRNTAVGGPLTNAQRLARGLPLRAPRQLYSPTRTRRQSDPSTVPTPSTISGYIAVYQAGTSTLRGYVNPAAATPSIVQSPPANLFSYTPAATSGAPVELAASGLPQVLAIGNAAGVPSLLSSSSANSARFLSTSAHTTAGSTPQRESTASARYLETTIFTIDPTTNEIMAEFVNYDGSKPTIAFVQQGAYLYGTGSSDRFMAIAPGAVAVTLMFVPVTA